MTTALDRQSRMFGDQIRYAGDLKAKSVISRLWSILGKENPYASIAKNAQMAVVPIQAQNADEIGKSIANLSHEAPDLVRGFFRNFPLVVVAGSTLAAKE
jgi:hypothetical protein